MFPCLQMVQASRAVIELSDGIYDRILHIQTTGGCAGVNVCWFAWVCMWSMCHDVCVMSREKAVPIFLFYSWQLPHARLFNSATILTDCFVIHFFPSLHHLVNTVLDGLNQLLFADTSVCFRWTGFKWAQFSWSKGTISDLLVSFQWSLIQLHLLWKLRQNKIILKWPDFSRGQWVGTTVEKDRVYDGDKCCLQICKRLQFATRQLIPSSTELLFEVFWFDSRIRPHIHLRFQRVFISSMQLLFHSLILCSFRLLLSRCQHVHLIKRCCRA